MKLVITLLAAVVAVSAVPSRHTLPELEWWESGVFYQIYPRSFKDSDGDGVGDLKGITSKLEHIKELGAAGTWLSPIFKSPMRDHGYDIEDFYAVDPLFGTMQDLEDLFKKAKELKLKVILDFVPNHSSNESVWFKQSVDRIEPYTNFYVWHNGSINATDGKRMPPNNWNSIFYGHAWHWNEKRQQYYYAHFHKSQPDLNYRNPVVVEEMKNVLRFWLKRGADGFRIDAINNLFEVEDLRNETLTGWTNDSLSYGYTHHHFVSELDEMFDMVYEWRKLADDFQKEHGGERRLLMTEAYTNLTQFPRYFRSRKNATLLGAQMPFNFVPLMELNHKSKADDFHRVINNVIASVPKDTRMNWVMGNHDQPRFGSRFGPEKRDVILAMILTLPGIGVTYNGEEIGMLDFRDGISWEQTEDPQACNVGKDGPWREMSRDPQRTPFQWDDSENAGFSKHRPWLPVHTNYKQLNLAQQKKDKHSTYKFYQQLMSLRKIDAFSHGEFHSEVLANKVFAYTRAVKGHKTYAVLLNIDEHEVVVDLEQLSKDLVGKLEVVAAGVNASYKHGDHTVGKQLKLGKYDAIVVTSNACAISLCVSLTAYLSFFFLYKLL